MKLLVIILGTLFTFSAFSTEMNGLDCRKDYPDYYLKIQKTGENRYTILDVIDLDVPGGHYERNSYEGFGRLEADQVEIKIEINDRLTLKIEGDKENVILRGIEYDCREI